MGQGTVDQINSNINHNGDDEYELYNGMNKIDAFASDHIGNDDPFAENVVAFRVMSVFPNNGDWFGPVRSVQGDPVTPSPSGFWATIAITSSNGNATSVATPGASGGAGGDELPVELMNFSVE